MASRYWSCRKCKHRNERTSSRKCAGCGEQTKPKKRGPAHAVALRDMTYARYIELNGLIHGCGEECAVCGREPSQDKHHDRDHGHDRSEITYAKPRGLACPGDWGCNKLMARLTLAKARQIVAYLERAEAYYQGEAA